MGSLKVEDLCSVSCMYSMSLHYLNNAVFHVRMQRYHTSWKLWLQHPISCLLSLNIDMLCLWNVVWRMGNTVWYRSMRANIKSSLFLDNSLQYWSVTKCRCWSLHNRSMSVTCILYCLYSSNRGKHFPKQATGASSLKIPQCCNATLSTLMPVTLQTYLTLHIWYKQWMRKSAY